MVLARDNLHGILLMNVAMCTFNASDAFSKLATEVLPIGETVLLRAAIGTILMAGITVTDGSWRQWRRILDVRMALRAIGEIGATVCYLIALVRIPLPNVSAVFQATPLAMTVAASIFLGEHIGRRRWAAIAVGFVGVLVIVRPGLDGFEPLSLMVLGAVASVVLRDISTAKMPNAVPASLIALGASAVVGLVGPLLMPIEPLISTQPSWVWPTPTTWGALFAAAVGMVNGYLFLIFATRVAETSAIAPYRYVLLVWACIFGYLMFGDVPDPQTLIGSAIVVGTGLYSLNCERTDRRRP
jgi:drug/metabolite transporter (DMT)-like permease